MGVVGSRSFNDYELMKYHIETLIFYSDITMIVSGGALGADTLAKRYADEHGIKPLVHYAQWDVYGRDSAGFIRNELIVKDSNFILAFWDGFSSGTKHTISLCKPLKKGLQIVRF